MESIFIKIFISILDLPIKIFTWPFLWLLKRIYPLKKLETEIYFYPRTNTPISFHVADTIPSAVFVFEIINASLVEIALDKLYLNTFSVGGGLTLLNNVPFEEHGVIKRGTSKTLFQRINLNDSQAKKLQEIKNERKNNTCFLDITAYFKVKFYGEFKKSFRIAREMYEIH